MLLLLGGDVERCPGPSNIGLLNKRGIKMFHLNVRGLHSNIDLLEKFIYDHNGMDIIGLTETHIQTNSDIDNASLYDIPGYSFVKKNRHKGLDGGVACYISDKYSFKRRSDLEKNNLEILWLEILLKNSKNFLLAIMYRPPDSSSYLPKDFIVSLNDSLLNVESESIETVLMGDINVNHLVKKNCETKDLFSSWLRTNHKQTNKNNYKQQYINRCYLYKQTRQNIKV